MRKLSCVLAALGAALAAILFLVRRSHWFLTEQAKSMSDFVELIESAYLASFLLIGICLVLFLLSFRKGRQPDTAVPPAPLEPEPWICRYCGNANPVTTDVCQACQMPFEPEIREWVCPRCGSINDPQAEYCPTCGYGKLD